MAIALIQDDKWMAKKINLPSSKFKSSAMDKNAEQLSVSSFKWTSTEYTPGKLLDNFQKNMPFLIMTTQGYLGRDDYMNTVASEEIYWLKGMLTISRIIVENDYNAYFSIPVNCTKLIIPYEAGKQVGRPTTLKKLLADGKYVSFAFQDDKSNVFRGPDNGTNMKLGVLLIVDKYDERYLMGHALSSGHFYHEITVIPVYMPITLVIAAGVKTGGHKEFYKMMLKMFKYSNTIPVEGAYPSIIKRTDEIMSFDRKPVEGEYDILQPTNYLTFTSSQGKRYLQLENTYTALVTDNIEPPQVPPPPPKASKKAREVETTPDVIKPRAPTPPVDELSKKANDADRSTTNIRQMIQFGHHVVQVDPRDVLRELTEVLKKGVIPETSSVKMEKIEADVKADKRKTVLSKSSGNPYVIGPRSAIKRDPDGQRHASSSVESGSSNPATIQRGEKIAVPSRTTTAKKSTVQEKSHLVASDHDLKTQLKLPKTISTFDDIPADLSTLDVRDVGRCLALLRLSKYRRLFEEEQVDGCLLLDLDSTVLEFDFGLSHFEAMKLSKFIAGWRPNAQRKPSGTETETTMV